MSLLATAFLLALATSCGGSDPPRGRDAGRSPDAGPRDAGRADAGRLPDAGPPLPCTDAPAAPAGALRPVAGELFYAQIGLGGFSPGEAALIVGPDGTRVLVDIGNDSHDDDVLAALDDIVRSREIDHVVLTHFHADHADGLSEILAALTLRGRIVHRGLTDLTPAANEATITELCSELAARPGADGRLCEAATAPPCDPGAWTGAYPAVACPGLDAGDVGLGSGAGLDFVAANGCIGSEVYEAIVGPLRTDDTNGENARSIVALLEHGSFRMLLAGDLTGGGSDTDDVESFLAARLALGPNGVDVLHASHHGRNTSSNTTWLDRALPGDGRSRNVVMGIGRAHLGSPHVEVLDAVLGAGRLRDGGAWTTVVSSGGATAPGLIDAQGGTVRILTLEGGLAYAVQAVDTAGSVIETRTFRSVASCL